MLHGVLRRVLPNPSDAAVNLIVSRWGVIMTTTSIMSLKKTLKNGFRSVKEHLRLVHKPIFETTR